VDGKESKTSDYTMSFVRNMPHCEDLVIDAELIGNEARHINDYRGVAEKPNAEFKNYRDSNGKVRVGVWVLNEKIKKGSEILVSYGKGFWKARNS
jgi:SET domain-containing protein